MSDLQEKVFFGSPNEPVFISNARMVLGGKTYFSANVTSVAKYVKKPSRKLEIVIGVLGILSLINSFWIGIFMVGLAALIWYVKKTEYTIRLGSSSGEADALTLKDLLLTNKIIGSINDAIVYRG